MTQAQHSAIVALLTTKYQLIETMFIEEMTDHFVSSIEKQMAESLSFQQALEQTVNDFGAERTFKGWNGPTKKHF